MLPVVRDTELAVDGLDRDDVLAYLGPRPFLQQLLEHIDRGHYARAKAVLGQSIAATQVACAPFASMNVVVEECASLEEIAQSLDDRNQDGMSRKKLAYAAYSRRTGKMS